MTAYSSLFQFHNFQFHKRFLLLGLLVLFISQPSLADDTGSSEVKSEMASVYASFKALWELSLDEDAFLSGKHDNEIKKNLSKLDSSFHSDQLAGSKYSQEPTYRFLLQSLGSVIEDAKNRFDEGKREYGLWRVKSLSNYCISCHTRLEGASFDFVGDEKTLAKIKKPKDKARYLLASRQFDKAADAYFQIALSSEIPFERERALSQWLLIRTRVEPSPKEAKAQLEQYIKRKGLTNKEINEVKLWQRGLNEWIVSDGKGAVSSVDSLLDAADKKEDIVVGGGVIEYLRATALLHKEMESPLKADMESKKLYQLATAYSELPGYFSYELPELFLERAIRLQPDTEMARKSFKLYEKLILSAHSGSGGTFLPDDIRLHTKELEQIAYGVPQVTGRV